VVRLCVTVIVLMTWTVFGMILWLPLLTRTMAYFTAMVALSSFSRKLDILEAQKRLDFAIEFYVYGYRKVLAVMEREDLGEITHTPPEPIAYEGMVQTIALDVVWTLVFWGSAIALWKLL